MLVKDSYSKLSLGIFEKLQPYQTIFTITACNELIWEIHLQHLSSELVDYIERLLWLTDHLYIVGVSCVDRK